jgi:hypothetical protein
MAEKKKVKVLILVDYQYYKCGQVVELDDSEATLLVSEGIADDSKGAIGA